MPKQPGGCSLLGIVEVVPNLQLFFRVIQLFVAIKARLVWLRGIKFCACLDEKRLFYLLLINLAFKNRETGELFMQKQV